MLNRAETTPISGNWLQTDNAHAPTYNPMLVSCLPVIIGRAMSLAYIDGRIFIRFSGQVDLPIGHDVFQFVAAPLPFSRRFWLPTIEMLPSSRKESVCSDWVVCFLIFQADAVGLVPERIASTLQSINLSVNDFRTHTQLLVLQPGLL